MELPVFYSHPVGRAGTSGCLAQGTPCLLTISIWGFQFILSWVLRCHDSF